MEANALVQNLGSTHLPQVDFLVNVIDKAGRDITSAGSSEDVRPGSVSVISGFGTVRARQLKSAKASLAIRAYSPVAAGIDQRHGLKVTRRQER